MSEWVVLRPRRLVLYANLIAAYVCFGYAMVLALYGVWYYLGWIVQVLAVGAFLTLSYFVGDYIDRLRR